MIGGQIDQVCFQAHIGSLDMNLASGAARHGVYNCSGAYLTHWHGNGRPAINHGMLAEQDDFAWSSGGKGGQWKTFPGLEHVEDQQH